MLTRALDAAAHLPFLEQGPQHLVVLACFVAAIVLVDSLDIALPRGDSISVSGALVTSALAVLGVAVGAATGILSSVLAVAVHRMVHRDASLVRALGVRAISVASAASVMSILGWSAGSQPLWVVALTSGVYLLVELAALQIASSIQTHRALIRLVRGNLERQGLMLLAQLSAAVLVVITFANMRAWALIPVVALLLLMRQSYAMLLDMRETYRMTVEVLVEVAEHQDTRRIGHGERTAAIARDIGARAGLTPRDLERLSLAALLHDVDAIGQGAAAGSYSADSDDGSVRGSSARLVEDAHFFADVIPILRACDGDSHPGASPGSDGSLVAAMIVALASDVDCARSAQLREIHAPTMVARVAPTVPGTVKARAICAAVELGYQIPAVP